MKSLLKYTIVFCVLLAGCSNGSASSQENSKVQPTEKESNESSSITFEISDEESEFIGNITQVIQNDFPEVKLESVNKLVEKYDNASYLQIEIIYSDTIRNSKYEFTYTSDLDLRRIAVLTDSKRLEDSHDVFMSLMHTFYGFEGSELLDVQTSILKAEVMEETYLGTVGHYNFVYSPYGELRVLATDNDVILKETPYK